MSIDMKHWSDLAHQQGEVSASSCNKCVSITIQDLVDAAVDLICTGQRNGQPTYSTIWRKEVEDIFVNGFGPLLSEKQLTEARSIVQKLPESWDLYK